MDGQSTDNAVYHVACEERASKHPVTNIIRFLYHRIRRPLLDFLTAADLSPQIHKVIAHLWLMAATSDPAVGVKYVAVTSS